MKKFGLQALIFVVMFLAVSMFQVRNHIPHAAKAPLITGQSNDGQMISKDLSDQTSSKKRSTLIYFIAPWSGVCKITMGNLNYLAKLASANIIIVGLDFEKQTDVLDLIKEKDLGHFELILGDNRTNEEYKIDAYPTYYIVSEKGEVITSSVGYSSTPGMLLRMWYAAAFGRF